MISLDPALPPAAPLARLNDLRRAVSLRDAVGAPSGGGGANIPTEAEIAETVKAYAELPIERQGIFRWKNPTLDEALDIAYRDGTVPNLMQNDRLRQKVEDYHQMLQDPTNSFYNEIYKLTDAQLGNLNNQLPGLQRLVVVGAFTINKKRN